MKSDAAEFAALMGALAAVILIVAWLLLSLIVWDFSVTARGVRALLVISFATAAVAFVCAKIENL